MNAVILKELNDLKRRVEAIEVWGNPFPPTLSPTHSSRKTPEAEAEAEEQINAVYTIERIKRKDKSKGSGKVFTATNKYKGKVGFGVWARSPHFKVSQTLDVGDQIYLKGVRTTDLTEDEPVRKLSITTLRRVKLEANSAG